MFIFDVLPKKHESMLLGFRAISDGMNNTFLFTNEYWKSFAYTLLWRVIRFLSQTGPAINFFWHQSQSIRSYAKNNSRHCSDSYCPHTSLHRCGRMRRVYSSFRQRSVYPESQKCIVFDVNLFWLLRKQHFAFTIPRNDQHKTYNSNRHLFAVP